MILLLLLCTLVPNALGVVGLGLAGWLHLRGDRFASGSAVLWLGIAAGMQLMACVGGAALVELAPNSPAVLLVLVALILAWSSLALAWIRIAGGIRRRLAARDEPSGR